MFSRSCDVPTANWNIWHRDRQTIVALQRVTSTNNIQLPNPSEQPSQTESSHENWCTWLQNVWSKSATAVNAAPNGRASASSRAGVKGVSSVQCHTQTLFLALTAVYQHVCIAHGSGTNTVQYSSEQVLGPEPCAIPTVCRPGQERWRALPGYKAMSLLQITSTTKHWWQHTYPGKLTDSLHQTPPKSSRFQQSTIDHVECLPDLMTHFLQFHFVIILVGQNEITRRK